ncbi:sugar O-acetyltransferase [Bifidobacterium phasiani]|uniref:Acetyltransferase n=1 Tax=Bifidobacterium phasiani TaxID=2834431 RepID=A0ABS6WCM8_9BIFI|nr:sugar O-acetyltransferase [Bifidobacterium phasiani]MBW3083476.1 sugar O-acetyltransferase [Bifidobacterium phasiani]
MAADLKTLLETDEDVRRLFEGRPMQYRKSRSLPDLTWQAQSTCARINRIFFDEPDEAQRLFRELVPGAGEGVEFRPPINLDYGIGLSIGERTFINKDFLIVGGGYIEIGHDCLIGPRCTICTPNHALDAEARLDGWEHTIPVRIGSNVWLGANVTICPGASIGDNSIIGAGSVVVGDIPADSIAVGNPCRVIRALPDADPAFAEVEPE